MVRAHMRAEAGALPRVAAMTPPSALPGSPRPPPSTSRGRTALVTGAAGGIGRACALRLAAAGAKVRAVDRDADGLEPLAGQARGPRGTVEPHVLDLTDLDAAERAAAGIDILVNNAGLQLVRPIEEFPPERLPHACSRVMLEAPFRLIRRRAAAHVRAGLGPHRQHLLRPRTARLAYKSAYVAAKHGLEGLSKMAALEGAPHGVTSNCVNPAYVRTPLVERQIADQAQAHGIPAERVVSEVMLADTRRQAAASSRRRSPRPWPICAGRRHPS